MNQEQKEVRERKLVILAIIAFIVITSLLGAGGDMSDQYVGY